MLASDLFAPDVKATTESRPVVVVRGFLAPMPMMKPLLRILEEHGFDVHSVSLLPLCIQDVGELGRLLAEEVDQILETTGASQCDLMGVSQGGLIALYYLRKVMNTPKVKNFVALATPFQGTWAAMLGVPLLGVVSEGIWQMLPTSSLLQDMQQKPADEQVSITSIAITGDRMAPPERCQLDGAKLIVIPKLAWPFAHQLMVFDQRVVKSIVDALHNEE